MSKHKPVRARLYKQGRVWQRDARWEKFLLCCLRRAASIAAAQQVVDNKVR